MDKKLKSQIKRIGIESRRNGKVIRLVLDMEVGFQTFKLHYSPMDDQWNLDGNFLNVQTMKSFVPVWSKLTALDSNNFDQISSFLVSHKMPLQYVPVLPHWFRIRRAWLEGNDSAVEEYLIMLDRDNQDWHYEYD